MRIAYTIVLLMFAVILSCKPVPASDSAPVSTTPAETVTTLTEYNAGEWIEDYAAALKFSQELSKPILVNFTGSDWCSWCIKLSNEVFSKPAFMNYAKENLILLKLDFPRNIPQSANIKAQNQEAQRKYGIRGYPTIVLIDALEREIGRAGYQPGGPENYVKLLESMIKN